MVLWKYTSHKAIQQMEIPAITPTPICLLRRGSLGSYDVRALV